MATHPRGIFGLERVTIEIAAKGSEYITRQRRRENAWQTYLDTLYPHGLNSIRVIRTKHRSTDVPITPRIFGSRNYTAKAQVLLQRWITSNQTLTPAHFREWSIRKLTSLARMWASANVQSPEHKLRELIMLVLHERYDASHSTEQHIQTGFRSLSLTIPYTTAALNH